MMKRGYYIGGVVIIILAVGIYRAKNGAHSSHAEIIELKSQIASVKEDIQQLRAELAYQSRHDRLAKLASEHLGMRPARSDQFINAGEIDKALGKPIPKPQEKVN